MTSDTAPIADADQDNPVGREQWFMKGRTAPPGQSAADLRYRAHLRKMQMRTRRARQSAAAAAGAAPPPGTVGWQSLGPAPMTSDAGNGQDYSLVSGRVNAVAIDPADTSGNTVYVGGAFGGLWRSTNAASGSFGNTSGVTWMPLTDNQPTLSFGAIAIQPHSNPLGSKLSNVVVVGTGEANAALDSYYGLGFLVSGDAGQTWRLISSDTGGHPFRGLAVSRMAFSTANSQLVVAGVAGNALGAETGALGSNATRGLYTSTDAGQTWTYHDPMDPGGPIDATSATSVVYNAGAGMFFAAIRYHGFYSSPDGINWTRLTNQPGGAILSTTVCPPAHLTSCPMYRGEIAVVPGRNEMYAWYVSINQTTGQMVDQHIWRTLDGGNTWAQIDETGFISCGDANGCGVQQTFFNMSLAAVPNGPNTDIYLGAVNEFKCSSLSSSSTTCGGGSWLNLTHVYGCLSIAKVHPDEHAVDFMIVNSPGGPPPPPTDVMYFGNDGGIYRALDGFTGLTTGTCGGTNQFDSLNATIGSMTQFVSMSQDPSNSAIILGGTQDNGSPGTGQATTSTSWKNMNAGDGGFNEINPNSVSEWFTANTDVSVQRCTSGINCTAQTLSTCQAGQFCQVVGNNTVGRDHGAFYTPYILDPQSTNNSELVVGTCRVWRGPGAGGTYTQLSNSFDNTTGVCTGNEVNLVRGLAAGGPASGGLSNVIYATTEGFGPLLPTNPTGGQVFVTINAAGGPSTWQNVTNGINPNQYVVSSVAIDASDSTGKTAYVTIMGFGTPGTPHHVWQTTNAGASWTDFSGAGTSVIPDAPANSVVIDSPSNTIYVGTDVGVFSSPTTGATGVWAEVGPAPSPGSAGFLPNVPVTKLRLFNSGGQKLLRASTYGRGIWQFTPGPDYGIAISNSPQSTLVTQQATFNGTVTADNGYSGTVNLACGSGAPSNCMVNPPSVTPTGTFTVTMSSNTSQAYSFNVNATGTDAAHTQHLVPILFNSNPDFTVTSPSGGQTVKAGGTAQYSLTFTPTGADTTFVNAVTYTCSGLPNLSNCSFSPAQIAAGTPAANGTVSLSIITTSPHSSLIGRAGSNHNTTIYALWLSMPGIGIVFGVLCCDESRRKRLYSAPGLVLFLTLFQVACGGSRSGPQPGTTPGTYTVTINATETVSHSTTVSLTVQ